MKNMETKSRARRTYLELRNDSSDLFRRNASSIICKKLLESEWYPDSTRILVYASARKEVDLTAFIEQAWKDEKEVYFPKVHGAEMEFYRVKDRSELAKGAFGIWEPTTNEALCRAIPDIIPILVPGVAFSKDRYRIGYGKGYYDRYLVSSQKNKRLMPIGIAYSFQIAEAFETDEYDYPMEEIVTEE